KFNRGGWMLVGGFIIFSLIYLLLPQFHREDWKSLVKSLPINKPIYMIKSSSDPVAYYKKNINVIDLKGANLHKAPNIINIIPYTAEIHEVDYASELIKYNFILKEVKNFRELKFETWIKNNEKTK
ncbi:MAG: hypothetical protein AAB705_01570, partial [Patescibacteria group bacterium]